MKVKELIEQLQIFNGEKEIYGVVNLVPPAESKAFKVVNTTIKNNKILIVLSSSS